MKHMANKKILLFLVEGKSDEVALSLALSNLYETEMVHVQITHGDITTKDEIRPNDIAKEVAQYVKKFATEYGLKPSDFCKLVHIVDMDGAYISDEAITEDQKLCKPVYELDKIIAPNGSGLVFRNKCKRENLEKLLKTSTIWRTIPYQVYYMSCNLDHVLYNKMNSTDEEKKNDAKAFEKKYKKDPKGFKRFISSSEFSISAGYDYMSSWKFIKEQNHSLERHTNLGVLLEEG